MNEPQDMDPYGSKGGTWTTATAKNCAFSWPAEVLLSRGPLVVLLLLGGLALPRPPRLQRIVVIAESLKMSQNAFVDPKASKTKINEYKWMVK